MFHHKEHPHKHHSHGAQGQRLMVHACGVCRYLEAGGDHGLAPSATQALGLEGGRDLLTPQPPIPHFNMGPVVGRSVERL